MLRASLPFASALLLALASVPAAAKEPAASGDAEAEAEVSLGKGGREAKAERRARGEPGTRSDRPWAKRWAPEDHQVEVGLYGGVFLPSRRLELFQADFSLVDQGYKPFARVAPDFGVRVGYYPLRFFGIEGEGGAMPSRTTTGDAALMWTARANLVGQLGLWSVTPFVLVGGGLIGVASDRSSVGNDVDASAHVGVGAKVFLSRYTALRLDLRDVIAARRGYHEGVVHSPEILLGLSITLGRARDEAPPPPPDSDGDGILDPDDACKDEPGVPDYRGCPIPDSDGDGILDPDDACKDEPETNNGFQDTDGCPDEIPEEVARFTGVIEGIFFENDSATIRPRSRPTLDKALEVLRKHESVRVEVSGHTDDRGKPEHNLELSRRRAESVKQYLVEEGIDPARITTRGAGPSEPIADNGNKRGRAKNRRIEFKLLTE
ncbi:MAG: OmpA family protein [Myxococcales bacterium]|nr:OmpA family protein [Myxococcales bacterium]